MHLSLLTKTKDKSDRHRSELIRLVSLCLAAPTPLLTTVTTTCTACNIQTPIVSLTHPSLIHTSKNNKLEIYMCRQIQQAAT